MQDDLLRAGDDDDAHAPYQQIPIQTVTIIPIALPTSNTARRIEQDSDVGMSGQVRVDIDGELVGGFAIGDEGKNTSNLPGKKMRLILACSFYLALLVLFVLLSF